MLRVRRIQIPHRLPPAFALRAIAGLKRKAAEQRREREALRVHPRLHEFLGGAEIAVAADEGEGSAHGEHPGAEEERVAVLEGPGAGAGGEGLGGAGGAGGGVVGGGGVVFVARGFEGAGVVVC